jgi:hypothetical protein
MTKVSGDPAYFILISVICLHCQEISEDFGIDLFFQQQETDPPLSDTQLIFIIFKNRKSLII